MGLHQINVGHAPEHDRLLVRISTTDKVEYRFWLTRHLVKGLWGGLLTLMQASAPVRQQAAPESRAALLEFEHQKALSESRFGTRYEDEQLTPALPGEPPLISSINLSPAQNGGGTLVFLPKAGAGITVQFNPRMLHAFAKLVRDASANAGWDLALALPAGSTPESKAVN